MKIILTMAISANGIIATKSGGEDFLSHDNWIQFVRLARQVGCFVWGRKTYDAVTKWEGDYLNDLKDVKKVIISRSPIQLKEGFILASFPEDAISKLEAEGFKEMIITGGATINSEFAKRGLIDEIRFDVNPAVLGEGIPVFSPAGFEIKLKLIKTQQVNQDIVELVYQVIK